MTCPECYSTEIELEREQNDGQGYWERFEYVCKECGCEWNETITKEIYKHGKSDEDKDEDDEK